ncbi:expansin-like B1 [Olea europaea subsp. europaea]|uniref:Expansin-like B1 n=1 Tax=Olea europaea subsp. europaea TaxID=158383 RepID=A0A8S0T255_OLEEU|nr:expansin-like B1 [Olea europaea subsp. europaea]
MGSYFFFFPMILLLAATCYGQGFQKSRASYYGSPEGLGTATGACGFGEFGKTVNNGEVAGVSRLYSGGSGCGACYMVKCKIPRYCSEEGANVVVTDYGEGDRTDFIMSKRGYEKMARPNMAPQLFAYGVVDIEYRRVPCSYNRNLELRIHENSNYPSYLALAPIYKDGMSDITGIDIGLEDSEEWSPMRRAYGTVFDISNPPIGSLHVRINYAIPYEVNLVQLTRAIPTDWKAGVAYDTASQLN